ncbi:MAG: PKD domain-containing protein, partial [Saprospiraceae bacterium]|nr:PKD domain-containing protein [Saprospiraceae bacterium]
MKSVLVATLSLSLSLQIAYGQNPFLRPQLISYIDHTTLSCRDVHTDCEGNIIYVGGTNATAFACSPNTISTSYNGGNSDAFIIKADSSGNILWKTLIGGNQYDRAYAVEVDGLGFIYVAGRAGINFPTTNCVLQQTFAGDNDRNPAYGTQDGFITKVSPNGQLIWSTYVGGPGRGFIRDIDVDSKGNVWAGMTVISNDFPFITSNAIQDTAFAIRHSGLVKISSDGSTLLYGSFVSDQNIGNEGPGNVRVDKLDNVILLSSVSGGNLPVSSNAFQKTLAGDTDFSLSKFSENGDLIFCTYLGGTGHEEIETHSLELLDDGRIVVAAYTNSTDFPVSPNAFQTTYGGGNLDGIIAVISPKGDSLLSATYIGGTLRDELEGVAKDVSNNIYVTGASNSTDFPVTADAFQPSKLNKDDGIIVVFAQNLDTVKYSTYIGGGQDDKIRSCHIDNWGIFHGGGVTNSSNIAILNPYNTTRIDNSDALVVKFYPQQILQPNITCTITADTIFELVGGFPKAAFRDMISRDIVAFENQSTGGALDYFWYFGDDSISTIPNPSHQYLNPGQYDVCLVVTNSCGMDTFCQAIQIDTLVANNEIAVLKNSFEIFPNPASDYLQIKPGKH